MSAPSRPLSPALPSAARSRWVEPAALTGLLLFHGFLSLQLFGPERPWQRLVDDEPIVSGRHPLHLYHATLAAVESCDGCCFDTTFYAGYPKTPVFDSDCRPVEWVLRLVGHQHTAVAYKIGLTVC